MNFSSTCARAEQNGFMAITTKQGSSMRRRPGLGEARQACKGLTTSATHSLWLCSTPCAVHPISPRSHLKPAPRVLWLDPPLSLPKRLVLASLHLPHTQQAGSSEARGAQAGSMPSQEYRV
jgi:hypothetical protein